MREHAVRWRVALLVGVVAASNFVPTARGQWDIDRVRKEAVDDWNEGTPESRARFFQRIGMVWPEAGPLVPFLIEGCRDPVVANRIQAANFLSAMDSDPARSLPALTRLLEDPVPEVRAAACQAIGRYGRRAEGAIGALVAAAHATRERPCSWGWPLVSIGEPADRAIADLSRSSDPIVRRNVYQGIFEAIQRGAMTPRRMRARTIASLVYAAAVDPDPEVRAQVAAILVLLDDDSPRGRAALGDLIRDRKVEVRLAVLRAVQQYTRLPRGLYGSFLALLDDPDARVRVGAVSAIPPQALADFQVIDRLLIALKHPDPTLREAAAQKLIQCRRQNGVSWLPGGGLVYHWATSRALLRHPDAARRLIAAFGDSRPGVRAAAGWLLSAFPAEAERWVPLLIEHLGDSDPEVRWYAAMSLARMVPPPNSAIRPLLALAANPDRSNGPSIRASLAAVQALDAIGGQARAKMVHLMIGRLGSVDDNERQYAHQAIYPLGGRIENELLRVFVAPATSRRLASEILPHLTFRRGQDGSRVTGPRVTEALAVIRSLAHDADPDVQMSAVQLLATIDPSDPEPAELYLDFLHAERDPQWEQRHNGWLNVVRNPAAIPTLAQGLADEDGDVRYTVAKLFVNLAFVPNSAEAFQPVTLPPARPAESKAREERERLRTLAARALLPCLKDSEFRVRWVAAESLGLLHAEPATVIPALVKMARTEGGRLPCNDLFYAGYREYPLAPNARGDEALRIAAIRGLGFFRREAASAVPELVPFLGDADPRIIWYAVEALGTIGPAARQAVPDLIGLLRSRTVVTGAHDNGFNGNRFMMKGEFPLRLCAASALGRIGPEARAAVPSLIAALDDPDSRVRAGAATALGLIGPDAGAAAPELVRLAVRGTVTHVAQSAVMALNQLGPAALPAIEQSFHDPDPATRARAVRMLTTMGVLPHVRQVARCLNDPVAEVRSAAASALLGVAGRPEALVAVPRLVVALADRDDDVRGAALSILAGASATLMFPVAVISGQALRSNGEPDDGFVVEQITVGR